MLAQLHVFVFTLLHGESIHVWLASTRPIGRLAFENRAMRIPSFSLCLLFALFTLAACSLNPMDERNGHIGLIGGGLTGCMTALLLNDLGYRVSIFEKRDELRITVR